MALAVLCFRPRSHFQSNVPSLYHSFPRGRSLSMEKEKNERFSFILLAEAIMVRTIRENSDKRLESDEPLHELANDLEQLCMAFLAGFCRDWPWRP